MAITLAAMAARHDERIVSATLFASQVDFTYAGDLKVFVDEEQVEALEKRMSERGYLESKSMATVFNLLRSNDLLWPYVINNYLKGKAPFPFDLLYWNSDATRMPAANHSFYLRNCYLENKLAKGKMVLGNTPIDLKAVKVPIYNLATREDHIAPAKSVMVGSKLFGGDVKFVVSGSGHIAGVINPPAKQKYQFWTGPKPRNADIEGWLAKAKEHPGSWWPDWLVWLTRQSPTEVPARIPGGGALQADRGCARRLCEGPGLSICQDFSFFGHQNCQGDCADQSKESLRREAALLRIVRILFVVGSLFAPGIAAASTPDEDLCAATPAGAEVIAACSRIIDSTADARDRAWAFAVRGRARTDQGDLTGAVADYSAALTLKPKYDSALHGRAVAYTELKNYDLALRDINQAIGLKPDNAEYYNSRGLTYRGMGKPTKALADFDQAIKLMPNYAIAFNNRGTAYNDLRQVDRDIEDFKQAIKLSPNYALAYYNLGETENDTEGGDLDQAIADLSMALKLNPALGPAWLNRGIAYARTKNTEAALA